MQENRSFQINRCCQVLTLVLHSLTLFILIVHDWTHARPDLTMTMCYMDKNDYFPEYLRCNSRTKLYWVRKKLLLLHSKNEVKWSIYLKVKRTGQNELGISTTAVSENNLSPHPELVISARLLPTKTDGQYSMYLDQWRIWNILPMSIFSFSILYDIQVHIEMVITYSCTSGRATVDPSVWDL